MHWSTALADYDRRLHQLESRVVASDVDDTEFSKLIRERTPKLLGSDDELLTRGPPFRWDPEFKVMFDALFAAEMAANKDHIRQRVGAWKCLVLDSESDATATY